MFDNQINEYGIVGSMLRSYAERKISAIELIGELDNKVQNASKQIKDILQQFRGSWEYLSESRFSDSNEVVKLLYDNRLLTSVNIINMAKERYYRLTQIGEAVRNSYPPVRYVARK